MRESITVLGGGQTSFGELWDSSLTDLLRMAVDRALDETKLVSTEIDCVVVGNMIGGETAEQAHLGSIVSSMLPHQPPALRVEAACASGGLAMHTACALLESGRASTILVIGAEKLTDVASDIVTSALMHAGHGEKDSPAGLTFPGIFGLALQRYMHDYGLTRDELSAVSEVSHRAAVQNPYAQFRRAIPRDQISKSALVADPLRLLDCSPITDGAAAVILSTKHEGPVRVVASALSNDHVSLTERLSMTSFAATKRAMADAMIESGWKHADVDCLELHDCFSIASIIHLEDMGFANPGEGVRIFLDGDADSTGSLPINCSGGLKACGHPIGATGVKQILDLWKQLTGKAPNQVSNAKRGLAHNIGGIGATCTIHCLEAL